MTPSDCCRWEENGRALALQSGQKLYRCVTDTIFRHRKACLTGFDRRILGLPRGESLRGGHNPPLFIHQHEHSKLHIENNKLTLD